MSLDPLLSKIEKAVDRYAREHNMSRGEALTQLLEAGLTSEAGERSPSELTLIRREAAEAMSKAATVRAQRSAELAAMSVRNMAVEQLIGYLADEPEIVGAIRDAGRERRHHMYGT